MMLVIKKNFNEDLNKTVYTVERDDGLMIIPAKGIRSLNYSSQEDAENWLPVITEAMVNFIKK